MMGLGSIKAAWQAFPPAPETAELKRMRVRSAVLCGLSALLVLFFQHIVAIHQWLVFPVVGVAVFAAGSTIHYWRVKNRADMDFAAAQATTVASDVEAA